MDLLGNQVWGRRRPSMLIADHLTYSARGRPGSGAPRALVFAAPLLPLPSHLPLPIPPAFIRPPFISHFPLNGMFSLDGIFLLTQYFTLKPVMKRLESSKAKTGIFDTKVFGI